MGPQAEDSATALNLRQFVDLRTILQAPVEDPWMLVIFVAELNRWLKLDERR